MLVNRAAERKLELTEHKLELIPQTGADGWQALCSCGWKRFRSLYEIENLDDLVNQLRRDFAEHVQEKVR